MLLVYDQHAEGNYSVSRDCRCPKSSKQPQVRTIKEDSYPEEVVAKLSELTETCSQTDPTLCPICNNVDSFNTSSTPWLVMPPGMKVKPGDKIPLPVLNNAKIINCSAIESPASTAHTEGPSVTPLQDMNSMLPMAPPDSPVNQFPLSLLPHQLSPMSPSSPMCGMSNMSPMSYPMMPLNLQQDVYMQGQCNLGNLSHAMNSYINQFPGAYMQGSVSPYAGMSPPGSMGPPPYPPGHPALSSINSVCSLDKKQYRNVKNKSFKANKICTILAKRKSGEDIKLGRPSKKKKINADFKMVGPAPADDPQPGTSGYVPPAGKKASKDAKALEPGEVPKEVFDKIKDRVVIVNTKENEQKEEDKVEKSEKEEVKGVETKEDCGTDSSAEVADVETKSTKDKTNELEKSETEETCNTEPPVEKEGEESQEGSEGDEKEKPLKIQSVSGVSVPADKCKDSPYYMVSPQGMAQQIPPTQGFAEFEFGPTGEKMLRCILYGCGQCFDTRELAVLHEKTHCARGQGLECPHCDSFKVVNTRWYHLLRHMEKAHDIKIKKADLQCGMCGLELENEETLTEHQSFHYYSHYKCIHCGIILFTWNHVKHHLKDCPDKEKGHFYHNCPYCHIVFHGPSFLDVHIKSHQDEGLVCCYCKEEKVWDSWKHLKKHYEIFHLAKEHKPLHRCMHCKMHFSSLKKYKVHMEKRHNPDSAEQPVKKRKRKPSQAETEVKENGEAEKKPVGKKTGRIRKKKSMDSEWVDGAVLTDEENDEDEDGDDDKDKEEKQDEESNAAEDAAEDAVNATEDAEVKKDGEEEEEKEVPMLSCPECPKKFRTKKRLDMHVERTHGEEVQCPKCDYVARNAYYMRYYY